MSADLNLLHPNLKPLAGYFLDALSSNGLKILVTCTYRTDAEQDRLYAQGRTEKGKIITNAKGGQSEHNFKINGKPASKAFDIVPLNSKGACIWDKNAIEWKIISNVWSQGFKNNGYFLDWLGKVGSKFIDFPHFCLKKIES